MRIMGLDYGTRTVGVAISDELCLTARALETIRRNRDGALRRTLARIAHLAAAYDVSEIVLGLPLHMDMSASAMSMQAETFGDMVQRRTALPVTLWDERLSSIEAAEILRINGISKKDEKDCIDMVAAKVILESYLEMRKEDMHT